METITNPHDLAQAGLCHYTGDLNPIDHDGAWYNSDHWDADGYADCVRIQTMPDGPGYGGHHVIIERINVIKPKDMRPALECCGATEFADNILAQIEACLAYGHYDPYSSDWGEPASYSYVLLDDEAPADDFKAYCRIHSATIATESEVWELLNRLVGRDSCA